MPLAQDMGYTYLSLKYNLSLEFELLCVDDDDLTKVRVLVSYWKYLTVAKKELTTLLHYAVGPRCGLRYLPINIFLQEKVFALNSYTQMN